jgi:hypothetical protein
MASSNDDGRQSMQYADQRVERGHGGRPIRSRAEALRG